MPSGDVLAVRRLAADVGGHGDSLECRGVYLLGAWLCCGDAVDPLRQLDG